MRYAREPSMQGSVRDLRARDFVATLQQFGAGVGTHDRKLRHARIGIADDRMQELDPAPQHLSDRVAPEQRGLVLNQTAPPGGRLVNMQAQVELRRYAR